MHNGVSVCDGQAHSLTGHHTQCYVPLITRKFKIIRMEDIQPKFVFRIRGFGTPELLPPHDSDEFGMDEHGNVYQYGINEWFRVYNWNPAEVGIFDGWTENLDNGYEGNLLYRKGMFYLNNHWNDAEYYGFQLRLFEFHQFKRMYHLLFDKHYNDYGKVEYPALLDYVKENGAKPPKAL